MERNLGIDYGKLARCRGLKKLFYKCIQIGAGISVGRYFDAQFRGKENIPGRSSIIATHHCVGFDWMMLAHGLDRKCHGWFDDEVLGRESLLGEALEAICIKTKNTTCNDLRRNRELSRYWIENTNEFVVSVTDGPSKYCFHSDGRVMDLRERPVYAGFVDVAVETGAPIVPYACWIPEEHRQELFSSKGILGDLRYLERNRKIPYRGMFGMPINPADYKKKKLNLLVRERQLEMEIQLKSQL